MQRKSEVVVIAAALALGLSACGSDVEGYESETARQDAEEITDLAAERARSAVEATTYQDQGQPYGCTDDCSGHDAGYEWAKENEVTDEADCGGSSQSFVEGCQAYAEAYQEEQTLAEEELSEE